MYSDFNNIFFYLLLLIIYIFATSLIWNISEIYLCLCCDMSEKNCIILFNMIEKKLIMRIGMLKRCRRIMMVFLEGSRKQKCVSLSLCICLKIYEAYASYHSVTVKAEPIWTILCIMFPFINWKKKLERETACTSLERLDQTKYMNYLSIHFFVISHIICVSMHPFDQVSPSPLLRLVTLIRDLYKAVCILEK